MLTTHAIQSQAFGVLYGGRPGNGRRTEWPDFSTLNPNTGALHAVPPEAVSRRAMSWDGVRVEIIQSITHDKVEFRFRGPWHLLLAYEEGVRDDGETVLGDLPASSSRVLRRKLTFVPAGHEFREGQRPRIRSRVVCFYFDPAKMPIDADSRSDDIRLAPRLFFENTTLWDTAVKLAAAIDDGCGNDRYCEALAVVVAHELLRSCGKARHQWSLSRGGLAVWQRRIVVAYVEEHLAEAIPLAALAKLVRLSPFHFSRAFKQSFGVPPHRYHVSRRMERAKALLSNLERSVTEIALELGFGETSSFSTAFRNTTGATPTEYRRALG